MAFGRSFLDGACNDRWDRGLDLVKTWSFKQLLLYIGRTSKIAHENVRTRWTS